MWNNIIWISRPTTAYNTHITHCPMLESQEMSCEYVTGTENYTKYLVKGLLERRVNTCGRNLSIDLFFTSVTIAEWLRDSFDRFDCGRNPSKQESPMASKSQTAERTKVLSTFTVRISYPWWWRTRWRRKRAVRMCLFCRQCTSHEGHHGSNGWLLLHPVQDQEMDDQRALRARQCPVKHANSLGQDLPHSYDFLWKLSHQAACPTSAK